MSARDETFFELTIVGCSGGVIDGKTCSFILKPNHISFKQLIENNVKDCTIAIDAGTGISGIIDAVKQINVPENRSQLIKNPNSLINSNYLLEMYDNSKSIDYYTHVAGTKNAFSEFIDEHKPKISILKTSTDIFDSINSYLITHAHLDHISGLVINSPHFPNTIADKSGLIRSKSVYGTSSTINILKKHVFNGKLWPDLSDYRCGKQIEFKKINEVDSTLVDKWYPINRFFKVKPFSVSHGIALLENDKSEIYESTAYLLGSDLTDKKLLMFGDVESDKHSVYPTNWQIWLSVSEYIISGQLTSIVIECSSINSPKNVNLFGHMNPNNLIYELRNLRKFSILKHTKQFDKLKDLQNKYQSIKDNYDSINTVNASTSSSRNQSIASLTDDSELYDLVEDPYKDSSYQPLRGLKIVIVHVKEMLYPYGIPKNDDEYDKVADPRHRILDQLNYLNEYYNLGVSFTMGLPGLSYPL